MTKGYNQGSISFGGLLLLMFIGLKLVEVISWSWWWVFSPLWIPIAIIVIISAFLVIIVGLKRIR